jgi:zinc protease
MARSKDAFNLRVSVSGNDVARGYRAALTELQRARLHGFAATELERAKTEMLRRTEDRYNERDKTESRALASGLVDYYLTNDAEPGIEIEYALQKKFLNGITIGEINTRLKQRSVDGNTAVTVTLPEKEGVPKPEERELRAVSEAVATSTPEPYVDAVADKPLVEPPANATDIAGETAIPELGVTEWRLSNGIRVVVKPTQFKNEEILFGAFSPGGSSLVDEGDQLSATLAAAIMTSGGVGEFSLTELKKLLTGKVATVQPSIGELQEGFGGSVAPKDLETMFQLVYLYFTAPRRDEAAYQALVTQLRTMLQNAGRQPEAVFRDTVSVTMAQYNPRRRPMTLERLDELNLDRAYEVFRDRFADAGDFTFVFVGNVNLETFRPLVLRYFGSLPVTGRKETWRDLGIKPPDGVVDKAVRKGIDKKSTVQFHFTGSFDWNTQNRYEFLSLIEVLRMRLREQVREEKSGTYGVQVMGAPDRYPRGEYRIVINFGCNPDRVEELTATTMSVLREIIEKGVPKDYIDKTQEIQRRERETNLKENRYWLGRLQQAYYFGEDPREILQYETMVNGLTPEAVQRAAARYLDLNHYARFVLLPE